MKLSGQKGITLIALVITIILMMILIGIGIEYGGDAINKAKLEDRKTDMISIKTRAKIIAEQYNFQDRENLVGTKYTEDTDFDKQIVDNAFSEFTEEEMDNLYIWTQEDLNNEGLNTIEVFSDSYYIVYYNLEDANSCEVYFSMGVDGNYSLTELQEME